MLDFPDERLSKNFRLHELCKSYTAIRRRINNKPSEQQIARLKQIAIHVLQPVRSHYGIAIDPSSGFRCPELNRAVGGSTTSDHVYGGAVDFEVPGVSNLELAQFIKKFLPFDQLILEHHDPSVPNSGWIHVGLKDVLDNSNRHEVKRYMGNGVYLEGLT